MQTMVAEAERVYTQLGRIPILCGKDEEAAGAVCTFWNYASAATVVDTKRLIMMAMQGQAGIEEGQVTLGKGLRYALEHGNWLVLHMSNGCCDLRQFDDDEEFPVQLVMDAKIEKCEKSFREMSNKHDIVVHPDFKVCIVSGFAADEIDEYYQHLELHQTCTLVVAER
eukprot:TRINITY_DN18917_c0_g1_i1.p1 TRINITY_DN18917_c0_g1~~TRINITY_DN18917_c0_g1_i1.p1  ORF type:complete len:168 (-),score=36.10 TRINITY_DN18917_c0_g1_i1:121-624(-)